MAFEGDEGTGLGSVPSEKLQQVPFLQPLQAGHGQSPAAQSRSMSTKGSLAGGGGGGPFRPAVHLQPTVQNETDVHDILALLEGQVNVQTGPVPHLVLQEITLADVLANPVCVEVLKDYMQTKHNVESLVCSRSPALPGSNPLLVRRACWRFCATGVWR